MRGDEAAPHERPWALVGVGGDELTALGVELPAGVPGFVIAGPPRSGRSTALAAMAQSLLWQDTALILVAPRPSPLRSLKGVPGVIDLYTDDDPDADRLRAALENRTGPVTVLIDDAEDLRTCEAAGVFSDLLRRGFGPDAALILAGDQDGVCAGFSGWQVEAKKARRGLLLSPRNIADGELIGVRLTRTAVGQPIRPGAGLLHLGDGQAHAVLTPVPAL